MARRKKGFFGKLVVLAVLAMAAFGGYMLYLDNQVDIDSAVAKVSQKAQDVTEVLSK